MEPKQLKGKRWTTTMENKDGYDEVRKCYFEEDVKSAVEWLKDELKKHFWVEAEKEYVIPFEELPETIDEAFHDVTQDSDVRQP
jgi:hypothetical protein